MVEVLDAPEPEGDPALHWRCRPSRELPYTAWVTIQMGCDNSCAFCIVPQVRGPEVSRPFDDIVAEVTVLGARGVTEVTLLGQNVNSYGRDLTRRRPLFAELLRAVGAVDGIRRVRFTSPHPKDLRPETIAAMAETPAVCEHLHLPLAVGERPGAQRHAARLHAPSATWSAWPRPAPPIDDLAVTTDIIVGFPGETDDDFERTLEVAAEAEYDSAYTFIFSPRPGTARRGHDRRRSCPTRSWPSASSGSGWWSSARPCSGTEARVGRVEEVMVEGPSKRDPAVLTRPDPAEQARPLRPARPGRPRAGAYAEVPSPAPPPTTCAATWSRSPRRGRRRIRIPVAAR